MKSRLSIFIKSPVQDAVKTRLADAVGALKALEIYKYLVESTLDKHCNIKGIETELSVLGEIDHPDIQAWLATYRLTAHPQRGDDLGTRMGAVIADTIKSGYRALLIGSDCPELDATYVRQAADALNDADIVFGPVEDGGYCLVGMNQYWPAVFSGIPWGGATVLADSIRVAQQGGLKVALLDTIWDVDYIEDWHRALRASDAATRRRFGFVDAVEGRTKTGN